jgi:hypothetical protein
MALDPWQIGIRKFSMTDMIAAFGIVTLTGTVYHETWYARITPIHGSGQFVVAFDGLTITSFSPKQPTLDRGSNQLR